MADLKAGEKAGEADQTSPGSAAHRTSPRAQFLRPTGWQLAAGVLLTPLIWLLAGRDGTVAFIGGALCSAVPQAYFALRMRLAARRSAAHAARAGLVAEGGKFLLSAVSFALMFAVIKPDQPGLVFLGFGVLWLVQTIATITLLRAA